MSFREEFHHKKGVLQMKNVYLSLMSVFFISSIAMAENANTLPYGKFRARMKPVYTFEFGSKFDETGNAVSLVKDLEVTLDADRAAKINPQLAFAMAAFGIDNLGAFDPSLKISSLILGTALEYGLTDRLTLGLIAPIVSANSTYQLQFHPSEVAKANPLFAQIDFAKAAEELAIANGYQKPGNWEAFGLGDVEVGLKYSLLKNEQISLALKSGVRLPTGRVDNPDHLTDLAFGDGQTDLGTTLLVDYTGLQNMLINGLLKYTAQLPDKQLLRLPKPEELFAAQKEELKRNLGDIIDASVYAQYTFLTLFNVNASYAYSFKQKDTYQSALHVDRLVQNSDLRRHTADVGLGFSTIPWVRQETFGLPMELGMNFQLPVAGKNIAKATTVNLEYMLYF